MRTITLSLPSTRNEVTQSLLGLRDRVASSSRDLVTKLRGLLATGLIHGSVLALKAGHKLSPKTLDVLYPAVDSDGCHTLPNGECDSPGPCIHTPR